MCPDIFYEYLETKAKLETKLEEEQIRKVCLNAC